MTLSLRSSRHVIRRETKVNLSPPPVACQHQQLVSARTRPCKVFVLHETTGMLVIYVDNIVFDHQSTPRVQRRAGTPDSLSANFLQNVNPCLHNRVASPLLEGDVVIARIRLPVEALIQGRTCKGAVVGFPRPVFAPFNLAVFVHMRKSPEVIQSIQSRNRSDLSTNRSDSEMTCFCARSFNRRCLVAVLSPASV